MSLPDEKHRSIFRMRDTLYALAISDKCKIPKEWKLEIKYALKHAPFSFDEIAINGEIFKNAQVLTIQKIDKYVAMIDKSVKTKKRKKKVVKKKKK